MLLGCTKATGTSALRFHKYVLSTGLWTHADSSTGANSGTPITRNILGNSTGHGATGWDGHILAIGIWNVVLSDAELEAIATTAYVDFDALITGWLATATAPRVLIGSIKQQQALLLLTQRAAVPIRLTETALALLLMMIQHLGRLLREQLLHYHHHCSRSRRPMPMMRGPDLDRPRYRSFQGRAVSTGMPRFDAQSFLDFTTTANGSWTHTPVTATPRGVVVLIAQNVVSTDLITGVTYGGVAMTRIATDGLAQDTVGEPGAAYAYFLGSNVPTGAQTVAVTVSSGTDAKTGWAVTLSGDSNQAIAASGKIQVDTLNPSVTLATDGYFDGVCLSVFFSGLNAPTDGTITAGTGYTKLTASAAGGRDFGTESACAQYASGLKGASIVCGWTAASDDCAMIALAVKRSP